METLKAYDYRNKLVILAQWVLGGLDVGSRNKCICKTKPK